MNINETLANFLTEINPLSNIDLNNKLIFKVKTDESKNELFDNIKCLDDTSIRLEVSK